MMPLLSNTKWNRKNNHLNLSFRFANTYFLYFVIKLKILLFWIVWGSCLYKRTLLAVMIYPLMNIQEFFVTVVLGLKI